MAPIPSMKPSGPFAPSIRSITPGTSSHDRSIWKSASDVGIAPEPSIPRQAPALQRGNHAQPIERLPSGRLDSKHFQNGRVEVAALDDRLAGVFPVFQFLLEFLHLVVERHFFIAQLLETLLDFLERFL